MSFLYLRCIQKLRIILQLYSSLAKISSPAESSSIQCKKGSNRAAGLGFSPSDRENIEKALPIFLSLRNLGHKIIIIYKNVIGKQIIGLISAFRKRVLKMLFQKAGLAEEDTV